MEPLFASPEPGMATTAAVAEAPLSADEAPVDSSLELLLHMASGFADSLRCCA